MFSESQITYESNELCPGRVPTFAMQKLTYKETQIHETAKARAQTYLKAEAALLESVMQVDEAKLYRKFGETSTFAYCVKYLGLSESVAYYFINVARKSREVPELKAAIDSGELSVSKATRIVSVLTPENQSEWIEKAKTLSKARIEEEIAKHSRLAHRHERLSPAGGGKWNLETQLSDEIKRDLERARDLESQRTGSHASIEQTLAAALDLYLEKNDPVRRAERAENRRKKKETRAAKATPVEISTVGAAPTELPKEKTGSEFAGSTAAAPFNSARAELTKRKALAARTEHHVSHRDKCGCQARLPDGSVCGSTKWIEIHHIIPLALGGTDNPENLITLCAAHHRQWHRLHGWRE